MVGRLVPIKDVPTFLRAARLVRAERPEARFALVGDGEERPALESLCRELGLDGAVTFFGWRHDLAAVYGDLDLVVNASRNEGTPVALIEALAAARPVVATRVGGTPDLLGEDERGRLVAAGRAGGARPRRSWRRSRGPRPRAVARWPVGSTSSRATRRSASSATWTRSTASCGREEGGLIDPVTTALVPILVLVAAFVLVRGTRAGGGVARAPLRGARRARARARSTRTPTPRIGGIAVFAAFTLVVLAGYFGVPGPRAPALGRRRTSRRPVAMLQEAYRVEGKLLALLLGGAIAFAVGLLDDVLGSRFGRA